MRQMIVLGVVVLLAGGVEAARLPGSFSNAVSGGGGRVRFVGAANTRRGILRGTVRCAGNCPVRGRLVTTCTSGGSNSWQCAGTIRTCTVTGSLYRLSAGPQYQASYDCGNDVVGAFSIGRTPR